MHHVGLLTLTYLICHMKSSVFLACGSHEWSMQLLRTIQILNMSHYLFCAECYLLCFVLCSL